MVADEQPTGMIGKVCSKLSLGLFVRHVRKYNCLEMPRIHGHAGIDLLAQIDDSSLQIHDKLLLL
jgi:hypothetical protein